LPAEAAKRPRRPRMAMGRSITFSFRGRRGGRQRKGREGREWRWAGASLFPSEDEEEGGPEAEKHQALRRGLLRSGGGRASHDGDSPLGFAQRSCHVVTNLSQGDEPILVDIEAGVLLIPFRLHLVSDARRAVF